MPWGACPTDSLPVDFGLQNCEPTHFCGFTPPSLGKLVTKILDMDTSICLVSFHFLFLFLFTWQNYSPGWLLWLYPQPWRTARERHQCCISCFSSCCEWTFDKKHLRLTVWGDVRLLWWQWQGGGDSVTEWQQEFTSHSCSRPWLPGSSGGDWQRSGASVSLSASPVLARIFCL